MKVLRTYARVYTADLDEVVPVLSRVTGQPVGTRFTMPNGLELATVGRMLVLAGDEEALAPFRATQATLIVDDLDEYQTALSAAGARLVRGPQEVPTGRNLTARLADGVQVEYVEWSRAQWEQDNSRQD
jgi:predicted enzyme related to lactoylglutathione lyase